MNHYERARACREILGIPQEKVAKYIEVEQPSYCRFEKGIINKPKYLRKLAELFDTTPGWLEYGEGKAPSYWVEIKVDLNSVLLFTLVTNTFFRKSR